MELEHYCRGCGRWERLVTATYLCVACWEDWRESYRKRNSL